MVRTALMERLNALVPTGFGTMPCAVSKLPARAWPLVALSV